MNASEIIKSIENEQLKAEVPEFSVGYVLMKMSTFNAKVFSCFFTFSNMHISKQLYLCILYNYMFLMGVGVGSGS